MARIRRIKLPRLIESKIYKTGQTRGADDDVIYQNRVNRNSTVLIPYQVYNICSHAPDNQPCFLSTPNYPQLKAISFYWFFNVFLNYKLCFFADYIVHDLIEIIEALYASPSRQEIRFHNPNVPLSVQMMLRILLR